PPSATPPAPPASSTTPPAPPPPAPPASSTQPPAPPPSAPPSPPASSTAPPSPPPAKVEAPADAAASPVKEAKTHPSEDVDFGARTLGGHTFITPLFGDSAFTPSFFGVASEIGVATVPGGDGSSINAGAVIQHVE